MNKTLETGIVTLEKNNNLNVDTKAYTDTYEKAEDIQAPVEIVKENQKAVTNRLDYPAPDYGYMLENYPSTFSILSDPKQNIMRRGDEGIMEDVEHIGAKTKPERHNASFWEVLVNSPSVGMQVIQSNEITSRMRKGTATELDKRKLLRNDLKAAYYDTDTIMEHIVGGALVQTPRFVKDMVVAQAYGAGGAVAGAAVGVGLATTTAVLGASGFGFAVPALALGVGAKTGAKMGYRLGVQTGLFNEMRIQEDNSAWKAIRENERTTGEKYTNEEVDEASFYVGLINGALEYGSLITQLKIFKVGGSKAKGAIGKVLGKFGIEAGTSKFAVTLLKAMKKHPSLKKSLANMIRLPLAAIPESGEETAQTVVSELAVQKVSKEQGYDLRKILEEIDYVKTYFTSFGFSSALYGLSKAKDVAMAKASDKGIGQRFAYSKQSNSSKINKNVGSQLQGETFAINGDDEINVSAKELEDTYGDRTQEVLTKIGVDEESFIEAKETGFDLTVAEKDFAYLLTNTEWVEEAKTKEGVEITALPEGSLLFKSLDIFRMNKNTTNTKQAEEIYKDVAAQESDKYIDFLDNKEAVKKISKKRKEAVQNVITKREAQLVKAGRGKEVSKRTAQVHAAAVFSLSRQFNENVDVVDAKLFNNIIKGEENNDLYGFFNKKTKDITLNYQKGKLFKAYGKTTPLHEMGHTYLHYINSLGKGHYQFVKAVKKAFGEDLESSEAQEKFSETLEVYLSEGKVPNKDIETAFKKFKNWVREVINVIRRIDGIEEITQEQRDFFDVLFSSKEEIAVAKQELHLNELVNFEKGDSLKTKEFNKIKEETGVSDDQAVKILHERKVEELDRQRHRDFTKKKKEYTEEAEITADRKKVYQFTEAMKAQIKENPEFRFNSEYLKSEYDINLKDIDPALIGGSVIPGDVLNLVKGYQSEEQLINALVNNPTRNQFVNNYVAERITTTFESFFSKENIALEATRAIGADINVRNKMVRELNQISQIGELDEKLSLSDLSVIAHRGLMNIKFKDAVNASLYYKNALKYGDLFAIAFKKKNYKDAFEYKKLQLINFIMFNESHLVKERLSKQISYVENLMLNKNLKKAAKAYSKNVFPQIVNIVKQYKMRLGTIEAQKLNYPEAASLPNFLAKNESVIISDFVANNTESIDINELPLTKVTEIAEALTALRTYGKRLSKIEINNKKIEADKVAESIIDDIDAYIEKKGTFKKSEIEILNNLNKFASNLEKVEFLIERLSLGETFSPLMDAVYNKMKTANDDMGKRLDTYREQMIEMNKKLRGKKATKKRRHKGFTDKLSKLDILFMLLNMGTAKNKWQLIESDIYTQKYTKETKEIVKAQREDLLMDLFQKELDSDILSLANEFWEMFGKEHPISDSVVYELDGLHLPKEKSLGYKINGVELTGGFVPIRYLKETTVSKDMLDDSIPEIATTTFSQSKLDRLKNVQGKTLSLDSTLLFRYLNEEVKDNTHRIPMLEVIELLRRKDIKNAMVEAVGEQGYKVFNDFLVGIKGEDTAASKGTIEKGIKRMRLLSTFGILAYKLSISMVQILGYIPSQIKLKGLWLAGGLKQYYTHPFKTREWVDSVSYEVKTRGSSFTRDVNDLFEKTDFGSDFVVAKEVYMSLGKSLVSAMDKLVVYPTFLAGYNKALAETNNVDRAIEGGERAVRMSQATGQQKDLSEVQRGREIQKIFTMFFSYFNVVYNQLRNSWSLDSKIRFATNFVVLTFVTQFLEQMMKRGLPEDDEEAYNLAVAVGLSPIQYIPFLREAGNAAFTGATRGWGASFQATPALQGFNAIYQLFAELSSKDPELYDIVIKSLGVVGGFAFPIPTSGIDRVGKAVINKDIKELIGAQPKK